MTFRVSLLALALSTLSWSALAADHEAAALAQYNRDRAACMSGLSHQDRSACLREAFAAYQEAKEGGLSQEQKNSRRNERARCEPLPPQQRDECQRRLRGQGAANGSKSEGGL